MRNIGGVTGRLAAAGAIFASAALLGACSPGAEYPTVLAPPAPRAEEPMSADQVKQATDALISDRTRLSADAQAASGWRTGYYRHHAERWCRDQAVIKVPS